MSREFQARPEPLAVVAGLRTPFARIFGSLGSVAADELGRVAVTALLEKTGLRPDQVDEVVFGNVASPANTANISRVIALRAGIPEDRIAHTIHRNCASGMEAIVSAWQAISERRAEVIVAGGTESMSNVPLLWDPRLKDLLVELDRQKTIFGKIRVAARFRPSMLKPVAGLQLGLTDPVCGLNMGQTAEVIIKDFGITRDEQDRFALRSHQRAVAAWDRCFYKSETTPVKLANGDLVEKDTGPRPKQTLESLAKLKPIFEPSAGTVTAGNSCPLTDGACAMIVMPVSRARDLGQPPLGYIRDYSIAGCDPRRMGLGPVHATQKLLSKNGMSLSDFDLFEINEAFAGQVIACQRAFASDSFAEEHFTRTKAIGEIPDDKLNVNGGAIALGHPVGTTGTRLVLTLLRALREKNLRRGLATLCIGGGQGMSMWVETELDSSS
jgi:acetyl-CoA acetyltransferase family protein